MPKRRASSRTSAKSRTAARSTSGREACGRLLDDAAGKDAGEVQFDDHISRAHAGDLVVVPPGTAHAFGALASGPASLLAVISPGIDRFQYFRHLAAVANGEIPHLPADAPARYDSRLVESAAWRRARAP